MYLKISSPEKQIYEGEIEKITIPTLGGELTILPDHQPLSSVVKSGIIKITPAQIPKETGYLIDQGVINISVSKGLLFVDGEHVIITTSIAVTSPSESKEILEKMKTEMEEKLATIKESGTQEDIEQSLKNLEKITADLRLAKLGHVSK